MFQEKHQGFSIKKVLQEIFLSKGTIYSSNLMGPKNAVDAHHSYYSPRNFFIYNNITFFCTEGRPKNVCYSFDQKVGLLTCKSRICVIIRSNNSFFSMIAAVVVKQFLKFFSKKNYIFEAKIKYLFRRCIFGGFHTRGIVRWKRSHCE